ncbi:hypothetical protein KUTeg_010771 [Tegillarca granosa]|uniref:Uncharacterized protein n=1 Tax=Tegillarca granosa TaxID=220873 RepID=A0ABQ9F4A8_TEGGR|nr:hypothetical protein KUTeg_010771 [Tegillarca granosa]
MRTYQSNFEKIYIDTDVLIIQRVLIILVFYINKMKSIEAKVVVLGSQGVGKTSVVIRYVGGMFSKAVSPTIGASFFTYKLNVNNYRVKLQVWDTAGQERFRAMVELKRNVDTPLVLTLVGNKSDLTDSIQVNSKEAKEYASSIDANFHEVSALKNTGIDEAFLQVAQQLIQLYETSPNSGLSSIDTQVPSTDNTNDSEDTNVKIQPKPGTKSQESAQSRCSC